MPDVVDEVSGAHAAGGVDGAARVLSLARSPPAKGGALERGAAISRARSLRCQMAALQKPANRGQSVCENVVAAFGCDV